MPEETRTAVVTGASSGFGRLTAERFAAAGWTVFAGLRDPRRKHAQTTAELERAGIRVVDIELTDQDSVDRAAAEILAAGPVDVLVNNAGVVYSGIVEAFTPEAIARQLQVNVVGPMRVSRAFTPAMRERGRGLIVFVSSQAARLVLPFSGLYLSSKWALEVLAETSAYELAPFGIDVAIVQPGPYKTNSANSRMGPDDPERLKAYAEMLPLAAAAGRALSGLSEGRDSRDVAEAIYRLAAMPAGTRPLRTVVPEDAGIAEINRVHETVQRRMLEAFGVADLAAAPNGAGPK